MRTITVTLPDDLADAIERIAAASGWNDEDTNRDSGWALVRHRRLVPLSQEALRNEISRGIEDCEQGRVQDAEELMARLISAVDERSK